jgi:hypothetical protein
MQNTLKSLAIFDFEVKISDFGNGRQNKRNMYAAFQSPFICCVQKQRQ